MSMSKIDYERIAHVFRIEVERIDGILKVSMNEANSDYAKAILRIVRDSATLFELSNPRFQKPLFYEACGLSRLGNYRAIQDEITARNAKRRVQK